MASTCTPPPLPRAVMAARAARCGSATPQGGEGCARRRGAQGRGSAMVFALRAGAALQPQTMCILVLLDA